MVFAGFTSAYIVSMGDTFWVKYPLPKAFWISTITIILSSLFYVLAIKAAKTGSILLKNNSRSFILIYVNEVTFNYLKAGLKVC